MAIEAHKCNVEGCTGHVVFENADFDMQKPYTIRGLYAYDNPSCNVCKKEFLVVPYYAVIDFNSETHESEILESAFMSEVKQHA
ncbi:hypothetical protein [Brevibacillus reuszeri]|uniref:hypothetical protein n=1 Tax=Brevibacillus reuszeri TaxID=54915 RepID=UPI00289F3FC9|nr:hypothetical protein [Brevibacillus reuszeri]